MVKTATEKLLNWEYSIPVVLSSSSEQSSLEESVENSKKVMLEVKRDLEHEMGFQHSSKKDMLWLIITNRVSTENGSTNGLIWTNQGIKRVIDEYLYFAELIRE